MSAVKQGVGLVVKNPNIDTTLRFGSHLFVNPEDTPEVMRACIAQLDKVGFKLIRLFMVWGLIEPEPGEYRWSPFAEIFDEAEARGMKVVPTLMSGQPPGWMGLTRGMQDIADLDDPAFVERSAAYLQGVVQKFRDHPALDSWILWNEPSREISATSPHAWEKYRKFIASLHGDNVAAYNATHFVPVTSFNEVIPERFPAGEISFISHRAKIEWLMFAMHDLQEKLALLASQVRVLDPAHPVHVNPHRVSQCLAQGGQSIWQEATVVDFMGCSAHPAWHSVRFPRARYGTSIAMFADLTRSATLHPDGYFWVTELQAGTTLLSAFEALAPSPEESRVWLWECVAAGAKGVVYWCANARTDGYEAGEWDLLDLHHQPTRRLELISKTVHEIEPYLARLSKAKPPKPDIGILISEAGGMLDLIEGTGDDPKNPRNQQRGMDAVCGAYLMAADLSLETRFYELERLSALPIDALPPILIAPSLTVVDVKTIEFLERAVRNGCLLIGDGFFGWKDPYGKLAREVYSSADNLWGARCSTYEAIDLGASYVADTERTFTGWFLRAILSPTTAETKATWTDRTPAVTCRRAGRGTAWRIGTFFFQRYFVDADPGVLNWLRDLVSPYLWPVTRLRRESQNLRLRRLAVEKGEFGVLINSGVKQETALLVSPDGRVIEVLVPAQNASIVALD